MPRNFPSHRTAVSFSLFSLSLLSSPSSLCSISHTRTHRIEPAAAPVRAAPTSSRAQASRRAALPRSERASTPPRARPQPRRDQRPAPCLCRPAGLARAPSGRAPAQARYAPRPKPHCRALRQRPPCTLDGLPVRPRPRDTEHPSRPDAASAASEPPPCLTRSGTEAQSFTARPFLALWSLISSVSPLPFTLPVKNAIEASMKTRRRPIEAPWQTFPLPPSLSL